MKLQDFPLLADENIHPDVVSHLRSIGCDVFAVRESNLIGANDRDLLRLAYSHGRVVITHDSDFGTLAVAQQEPMIGLVFLRPGHVDPQFTLKTLDAILLSKTEVTPPFIIVARRTRNRVTIRVRNPG